MDEFNWKIDAIEIHNGIKFILDKGVTEHKISSKTRKWMYQELVNYFGNIIFIANRSGKVKDNELKYSMNYPNIKLDLTKLGETRMIKNISEVENIFFESLYYGLNENWLTKEQCNKLKNDYSNRLLNASEVIHYHKWLREKIGFNCIHEWNENELRDLYNKRQQLEELKNIEICEDKLLVKFDEEYEIKLTVINNERDLLNVCYELLNKDWINNNRLKLIISIVNDIKQFDLEENLI